MTLFLPNIPQPNDNLDFSQGQLLSNNQGLDSVFGIEHYKFSDASANKGFHNKVTTPPFVDTPATGSPPVTVANPIFYGFQQTAPVGVIQYSRGPNNAVPTPLTMLQSPAIPVPLLPAVPQPVLDFTGLPFAMVKIYASNTTPGAVKVTEALVTWNGASFVNISTTISSGGQPIVVSSVGAVLNIQSAGAMASPRWTVEYLRLE